MTTHPVAQYIGKRDRALAFGVGFFLFAVYLLSYRGGFHSVDEVSMFAVAENLVKFGQLNTDQIAWTQWTTSQREAQGFFGIDGHVYSKKGPFMSLAIAPLYWLGLVTPGLGMLQAASLLNAITTAVTGGLLFLLIRRLGFGERIALAVAILFGLATIAWVYAKYLFSEPLASLLLLTTAYLLVAFRQKGGNWRPALAGLLNGLAVATRANNLFLIPIFVAYLLAISWKRPPQNSTPSARDTSLPAAYSLLPTAYFLIGLILPALLLLGYNWVRAGNPFQTGYDLTIFSPNLLLGLYKVLFSPLRGLFVYSPLLILGVVGLIWLWRRHAAETALSVGVIGITFLIFSLCTSGEGLSWGSRFLVPVVPFLCLGLAPILERAWAGSKILIGLLLGLGLLSFAIQLLGVAINPWVYLAQLQADFGGEFFLENTPALTDFRYSQVMGQLQSWSLANSDLVWWQPWGFDALALSLSLILVIAAAVYLRFPNSHPIALFVPTLVITFVLLLRYFNTDQQFGPPMDGYTQALSTAAENARPGETTLSVAPYHYHVPMNRFKDRLPIVGFAQSPPPLPDTALPLLRDATAGHSTSLVTVGLSPAAADNSVEQWLALNAFKATDEWFDDQRLVWYGVEQPTATRPIDVALGDEIQLVSVKVAESVPAGQILPVEIDWAPLQRPSADYTNFLQLLAADGSLVAQHDGPPYGGYAPTSTWAPGEQIPDRHGLALPADLPPATYGLVAGVYDPVTDGRLHTSTGADFVDLGKVTIR